MTPIETLIEKLEAMPAAKYEPVVIGIIDLARSLLPQEREAKRKDVEEALEAGIDITLRSVFVGSDGEEVLYSQADIDKGKSDYFTKKYGK